MIHRIMKWKINKYQLTTKNYIYIRKNCERRLFDQSIIKLIITDLEKY